jgi:hypothetical protein
MKLRSNKRISFNEKNNIYTYISSKKYYYVKNRIFNLHKNKVLKRTEKYMRDNYLLMKYEFLEFMKRSYKKDSREDIINYMFNIHLKKRKSNIAVDYFYDKLSKGYNLKIIS